MFKIETTLDYNNPINTDNGFMFDGLVIDYDTGELSISDSKREFLDDMIGLFGNDDIVLELFYDLSEQAKISLLKNNQNKNELFLFNTVTDELFCIDDINLFVDDLLTYGKYNLEVVS